MTEQDRQPDCVLRISGLTKRYGDLVAVDRLELEVRSGEILGFLGPNGAGKTTTLKMLSGLLRPDAGTIELAGAPLVRGKSRGLTTLGVVPQNLVIWETLTAFEQLELVGCLYGLGRAEARARAQHLLTVFGLEDKAHRLGKTLSGGMQRRLNIALGLVHAPRILLLDEPQAGLDPQSRVLVRDYVRSLRGKMTIIITTHDMEEAEKLADRVCIVDHGRILALDTMAAMKRRFGEGSLTEIVVDAEVKEALLPHLGGLSTRASFTAQGNTLCLTSPSLAETVSEVLSEVSRRGLRLIGLRTREATLEDVFIALTGRNLRE
jgi:ABC-2 type transport system ATP-binding protein